jgi:uncharacterized protein YndB with AHSA1/START domain
MPQFDDFLITPASAVAVWKVLYDPLRFAEWWTGFEKVTTGDARGGDADVTLWPEGYPDFALPQRVESHSVDQRIVVSCTVSELVFEWRLEPVDGATRISVHVEIPEAEAAREAAQREVITSSLRRLAALAESSAHASA